MIVNPSGEVLGASISSIDLRQPLSDVAFSGVLQALGKYAVLCFPDQLISPKQLTQLSARFGELQLMSTSLFNEPGVPEVSILSNIVQDGKPIGAADAGQSWHTDMTYNAFPQVGFVNVLVAHAVPMREGKPLGGTEFTSTARAYLDLPEGIKAQLADATAVHNWGMYWEMMRREKGSSRPPLTNEQRSQRPPATHPVFLTHPITGRKVIYVNPGFTELIVGMDSTESQFILDFLFAHVLKPQYRYVHKWKVGDVLIWDHLSTWHNAIADYLPSEHRIMKRCQVMANKIFDKDFVATLIN
ncbi:MAG: TauD/TfdA family dioxygenase [Limnohabitans sp.]|nr:TauD/TfdA family dioxygenase [Limnohabitans sp.]